MVREVVRREVRELIDQGAQLVEVLAAKEFDDAHLPGAVNIPLDELPRQAPSRLDPDRAVVVYCYDTLCDMSARAAARLGSLGFTDVYDYVGSKMDWIGAGLPFEGARADGPHLAALADRSVPTCGLDETVGQVRGRLGDWELCLVVDDHGIVLGLVRAEALALEETRPISAVMQEAPRSHRPHVTPAEIKKQVERSPVPWLLVTNLDGTLVGVARPDEVLKELDHG